MIDVDKICMTAWKWYFSWHWLRWWRWMVENKNIHEFIGRSWEIFHRTTFTVCCKISWYLIFVRWDIWCSWNICLTFHGMCDEIFVQISACLSLHSWLHQFSSKCDVTFLPPPAPARLFWKNSSEIAKQEINWFVSRELQRAAVSRELLLNTAATHVSKDPDEGWHRIDIELNSDSNCSSWFRWISQRYFLFRWTCSLKKGVIIFPLLSPKAAQKYFSSGIGKPSDQWC